MEVRTWDWSGSRRLCCQPSERPPVSLHGWPREGGRQVAGLAREGCVSPHRVVRVSWVSCAGGCVPQASTTRRCLSRWWGPQTHAQTAGILVMGARTGGAVGALRAPRRGKGRPPVSADAVRVCKDESRGYQVGGTWSTPSSPFTARGWPTPLRHPPPTRCSAQTARPQVPSLTLLQSPSSTPQPPPPPQPPQRGALFPPPSAMPVVCTPPSERGS